MSGGNIPNNLKPIFVAAGNQYHIPPNVLAGVADVESTLGSDRSTSSAGAVGLMQFLPSTAQSMGINPLDDRQAIFGAAKLLASNGYAHNPMFALGAYNGGPGNPQYGYARDVMSQANRLKSQLSGVQGGGSTPQASPGAPGAPAQFQVNTTNVFDQAGFQKAQKAYTAGTFLSQLDKSNPYDIPVKGAYKPTDPVLTSGLLTTTPPNPQDFVSAQSTLQKIAGGTQLGIHPVTAVGHSANGLAHPFPSGWQPNRLDMGFDGTFRGNIVAPFNGVVTFASNSFSNWGGYMVVRTADGRNIPGLSTNSLYFAEGVRPTVHSGQQVRAGQPIAQGGPSPYGNAYATSAGGVGQIEWGPAQAGINGQPTDPLAKQFGLGSAASRGMVLAFAKWAQGLGIAGPTQTGNAGAA